MFLFPKSEHFNRKLLLIAYFKQIYYVQWSRISDARKYDIMRYYVRLFRSGLILLCVGDNDLSINLSSWLLFQNDIKKNRNNGQFNAHFIVKLRQIDFGFERIFLSHSITYFVEFHNFQYIYSFLIEKLWPQQVWILFLRTDDGKKKLLLDFFFTREVCNSVTYRLVSENHMWLWPDKFMNNFVDRCFNRNNRSNSCNMCITKLDPLHSYESTEQT